jgi:hypothetical protein
MGLSGMLGGSRMAKTLLIVYGENASDGKDF